MNKAVIGAAVAMALLASGCDSTKNPYDPDKPLDKMTKEEWCAFYGYYLTNPQISAETRRSATAQMRARGCAKVS